MIPQVVSALMVAAFVAEAAALVRASREAPPFHRIAAAVFPVSQSIAVCPFVYLSLREGRMDIFVVVVLLAVGCGVANWFLLAGLRRASMKEKSSTKARVLEDQLAMQDKHFDALLDEASEAMTLSATLVAYLREVKRLVASGEAGGVSAELRSLTDMRFPARLRFCQNKVVDALMMAKSEQCAEAGVRLSCKLDVPGGLDIPGPELCAVFSNIVDNALAACAQLPPEDRSLSVKARCDKGLLVVEGRNSCKDFPVYKRRRRGPGEHLSRHGWGLEILRTIAARHDGMVETSQHEGEFTVTVMLAA